MCQANEKNCVTTSYPLVNSSRDRLPGQAPRFYQNHYAIVRLVFYSSSLLAREIYTYVVILILLANSRDPMQHAPSRGKHTTYISGNSIRSERRASCLVIRVVNLPPPETYKYNSFQVESWRGLIFNISVSLTRGRFTDRACNDISHNESLMRSGNVGECKHKIP